MNCFKERSLCQGYLDIRLLGTPNWQGCYYKALCCLESSWALFSIVLTWGLWDKKVRRVPCLVGCKAWHTRASLGVMGCLGTIKSGNLGEHVLHGGPHIFFFQGLLNNMRGPHELVIWSCNLEGFLLEFSGFGVDWVLFRTGDEIQVI